MIAAFIHQLHSRGLLKNPAEIASFVRLCLDLSLAAYDLEAFSVSGGSVDQAYVRIDALASLIIALTLHHSTKGNGEGKIDRVSFFDSILAITVMSQCDHWRIRGEHSNQKVFFRLYSSLLFEINSITSSGISQDELFLTMAKGLLTMQPTYLPGFVFGWLALISHRVFIPVMLHMENLTVSFSDKSIWSSSKIRQATDVYLQLLHIMFETVKGLMGAVSDLPENADLAIQAQDFYRGVLRVLVILHHDFPEFLVENHVRLCNSIPDPCVQLKNLILSAIPANLPELPSPFTPRKRCG